MEVQEYKSTIKSRPFLYHETKKAAELTNRGLNQVEIRIKAKEDNLFQVNTEARKGEIASVVLQRLQALDDFFIRTIAEGSMDTSKLIVLYAIMKTDRLFFEFMYEVYRDKMMLKDFILQDKDFSLFFDRKKEQSNRVASWDDYTFYKIKQVYKRILVEADLLRKKKKENEMIPPLVEQEVIDQMKDVGDDKYLQALIGAI